MSVTTTSNARVIGLRETLAEYALHHSETNPNPETGLAAPATNPTPDTTATADYPSDWDTSHRRVPPYRPVRPENNNEERNSYTNNVERVFIIFMLRGVQLQSSVSHAWRATGEKITGPSLFKQKVGGEW